MVTWENAICFLSCPCMSLLSLWRGSKYSRCSETLNSFSAANIIYQSCNKGNRREWLEYNGRSVSAQRLAEVVSKVVVKQRGAFPFIVLRGSRWLLRTWTLTLQAIVLTELRNIYEWLKDTAWFVFLYDSHSGVKRSNFDPKPCGFMTWGIL